MSDPPGPTATLRDVIGVTMAMQREIVEIVGLLVEAGNLKISEQTGERIKRIGEASSEVAEWLDAMIQDYKHG